GIRRNSAFEARLRSRPMRGCCCAANASGGEVEPACVQRPRRKNTLAVTRKASAICTLIGQVSSGDGSLDLAVDALSMAAPRGGESADHPEIVSAQTGCAQENTAARIDFFQSRRYRHGRPCVR